MQRTTAFIFVCTITFLIFLFFSCQKNPSANLPPTETIDTVVSLPVSMVTISVSGIVTDENNNPVANASIIGGNKIANTNADGVFKLTDGSFNSHNAEVRVEKDGYFIIIKTFIAKSGKSAFLEVKLSPKTTVGSVSSAGGTISFASGNVILTFPADAFKTSNGTPYNGTVTVKGCYMSPDDNDLGLRMPGNLMGVTAPSTMSLLRTFGMVGVELYGSNNESIQMATGKKATMSVAIPAANNGFAPDSLPMWFFSNAKAIWIKEGIAIKTNNRYVANIGHFSFWNYDWPSQQVLLEMTVWNAEDSTPLPYAAISLTDVMNYDQAYASTNSSGYAGGYVFKNAQLRMRIRKCGQTLIDTLIGPYNANTDLGNLYFTLRPQIRIQGYILNCSGQPVTKGSASATINGLQYTAPVNSDGLFSIEAFKCTSSPITTTVTGIDSITGNQITPQTITVNPNPNIIKNLGPLMACPSPPDQYISYTLDGTNHLFIRNTDSAFCTRTYAFNRTNIACRRANGSPFTEGYVAFITGPTSVNPNDTSSILTLHQYTTSSTPSSLNIIDFEENYNSYPPSLTVPGWVIGTFYCKFYDQNHTIHTIRSYFRMWRQ